jgi:hypothetical protein
LAKRQQSVAEIVKEHWATYGRNYYSRHDYEEVDAEAANLMMKFLRDKLPKLKGEKAGALAVATADDFAYNDIVDGSNTANQGIRIVFEDGSRVIYRLSGTGTAGATLRVYIEKYEAKNLGLETQAALSDLISLRENLQASPSHVLPNLPITNMAWQIPIAPPWQFVEGGVNVVGYQICDASNLLFVRRMLSALNSLCPRDIHYGLFRVSSVNSTA